MNACKHNPAMIQLVILQVILLTLCQQGASAHATARAMTSIRGNRLSANASDQGKTCTLLTLGSVHPILVNHSVFLRIQCPVLSVYPELVPVKMTTKHSSVNHRERSNVNSSTDTVIAESNVAGVGSHPVQSLMDALPSRSDIVETSTWPVMKPKQ